MSGVWAIAAWLAALNPPRTRLGLPAGGTPRTATGIVLGVATLIAAAAGAQGLLDTLEISPETFRIAAGFVLVIVAAVMLFAPVPTAEPVPEGAWAWVWPVAYPRVVSPETLALALTTGSSDGLGVVIPGVVSAAFVLFLLVHVAGTGLSGRALAATGRVLAVVLVLAGVWLAIQGIREV
jgi:small neutral amino acid transporter SnatA (MarC family)